MTQRAGLLLAHRSLQSTSLLPLRQLWTSIFSAREKVDVGSLLRVRVGSGGSERRGGEGVGGIAVVVGQDREAIAVNVERWGEGDGKKGGLQGGWQRLVEGGQEIYELDATEEAGEGLRVSVEIPERFCSVQVCTAAVGGSVSVEGITEGSCRVETSGGGSITLGKIRGSDVSLESAGGAIDARMVQANAKIRSRGGSVTLRRVQGVAVDIGSDGGRIHLGPTFANTVHVRSHGGDIQVDSVNASEGALLDARGDEGESKGKITADLVDGKAQVLSDGGGVELTVAEGASSIACHSTGPGDVVLAVPSQTPMVVDCRAAEVVVEDGIKVDGESTGPSSLQGSIGAIDEGGWSGRIGAAEFGSDGSRRLKVVSLTVVSEANVRLKRGSWLEAIQASLRKSG